MGPSLMGPSLTGPSADAARGALLRARAEADEAAVALRRSTALGWESSAADAFRDDVAGLLASLGGDLATLDEAAGVIRR